MKAAFITSTGSPDCIQYADQPQPQPTDNQVLVKVAAVAVNPIDTYIRSGAVALPLEFPYIIGCDLAGEVEAVGQGVTRFKIGDRVWGSNQGLFGRPGTFAEYTAVDEQWLYPTPAGQCDEAAAAGALVGITAHLGLFRSGRLQAGEIVFVNGGTGGVGSSVVQLAKGAGATVIATVGNAEKQAACKALGADLVVDYHSPTMDDEIRQFIEPHGGIDLWYETQRSPNFDRTVSLMRMGGRIIFMAGRDARPEFPVGPSYTKDLSYLGFAMFNASAEQQRECATGINRLQEAGGWTPIIGQRFPLSEAAAAHQLQEEGTLQGSGGLSGKIVLTV
ncbi:Zinc-type alcohol dehydrogenase-like protein [Symmachiella macrocystis]|uniref:Zinc-type alcohol dehydrogenase-like protein n=1 Tax=Symmachiella macrocystis TaxID=2527985 RepID=A0A5C6BU29_9PLAN|nr:NADPH:quinone reductase [Symmachiella macrocystis]TWU14686.1 Zinc-type alcohol dehydrogenase-like protein [Symmachiella macrocystis]